MLKKNFSSLTLFVVTNHIKLESTRALLDPTGVLYITILIFHYPNFQIFSYARLALLVQTKKHDNGLVVSFSWWDYFLLIVSRVWLFCPINHGKVKNSLSKKTSKFKLFHLHNFLLKSPNSQVGGELLV